MLPNVIKPDYAGVNFHWRNNLICADLLPSSLKTENEQ